MPAPSPAIGKANSDFEARLTAVAQELEGLLQQLLSSEPEQGESARPARLLEAMRYAVLEGGKRLRPYLVLETARLFDAQPAQALMAAAAVECVHAYSLIHDDLPAMDNDALRRGRPTVHRAFDEATAILAGDALLTLAFDLLAREATHPDPAIRIALVAELARSAGLGGMAGGQMLDLAAEGRFGGARKVTEEAVFKLEAMKTGALIRASCVMGAIVGGAPGAARNALGTYGHALGQAFQIADDLLDREGDPATLGKATEKDEAAGKATLIDILGIEGARARLAALVAAAERALDPLGEKAATLRAAAQFVAERRV